MSPWQENAEYLPPDQQVTRRLHTDGKTIIGWDVDLFNAVAAKLGLKTEWQSAVFDAIIPGIQSEKYEMASRRSPSTPTASSRSTW